MLVKLHPRASVFIRGCLVFLSVGPRSSVADASFVAPKGNCMVTLTINGLPVTQDEGATILEAARFLGFPIPTLCHMEGLSPYGACRLCIVEIGEGAKARLVSSCTYPVENGLKVRTGSSRVLSARRMII